MVHMGQHFAVFQQQIVQGGEKNPIARGSILFIPAESKHQFVEIEEDLSLLVFFGSGGPSGAEI